MIVVAGLLTGCMFTSAHAQELMFAAGGPQLNLDVTTVSAGSQPAASDNSTMLYWDANFGATMKLTVSTICLSQAFRLFVELQVTSRGDGTAGNEQPEVELLDGMLDADLLRDIPSTDPQRKGYGTLTYRVEAPVSAGSSAEHGDDLHTVIFTMVAQ